MTSESGQHDEPKPPRSWAADQRAEDDTLAEGPLLSPQGRPPSASTRPEAAEAARGRRVRVVAMSAVTWPRAVFVAGAVALAYIGSGLPSHDWTSLVAVALPAAGILVLAMMRPVPVRPVREPRVRRAVLAWALLLVVAVAWEAWAFLGQSAWNAANPAHPTFSTLVDPLLDYRAARFAGWLAWLWVGRKLVGR